MGVSNRLKEMREEMKLSQEEVARMFRQKYCKKTVTQQHISLWEKGTVPNLEYALILSKIYKHSVEELFRLE